MGPALAWFRPKTEKPILTLWQKTAPGRRLGEATRRHPQAQHHAGRAAVHSAPFPGADRLVVRPCVHGGFWGRLTRDLYPSPARVLREIRASEHLEKIKIPTPRIEAVILYPAGPFYRFEVVTRQIPESQDLVQALAGRPSPAVRTRLFSAVRKLLSQLHRHGIRHPDLNARNILLAPSRSGWTAYLLDVDAVLFETPSAPAVDTANRHRLLRSLLKRARLGDLGWSEAEVAQLWRELFPRR